MQLWAIGPELILAGVGLALVPVSGWGRGMAAPMLIAALGLIAAMVVTAVMVPWEPRAVFCETYAVDGFAAVFKLMIELSALITLALLWVYFRNHPHVAKAPPALIFTTLGAGGLAASLASLWPAYRRWPGSPGRSSCWPPPSTGE